MQKIALALVGNGYAKVKLNTFETGRLTSVFEAAHQFFGQSKAEKLLYKLKGDVEGYREIGAEFSLHEDRPDLNEAYGLVLRNVPAATRLGWGEKNALYRTLVGISEIYEPKINELFEAIRQLVNPQGESLTVGEASYLQVNYYRPSVETRDYLQDHHEDGHLLTVVKALEPGLEIRPNENFEPVSLDEDEILLMPGSLLEIMTGGDIPALWHRVRNTRSQANRASMMFFVNPRLDRAPKPWKANGHGQYPDLAAACVERSVAFGLEPIDTAV